MFDGEQWLDRRGKGNSLKQVVEQLQNDSNSGEEFDLEENKNAKRIIKIDTINSGQIDNYVYHYQWQHVVQTRWYWNIWTFGHLRQKCLNEQDNLSSLL